MGTLNYQPVWHLTRIHTNFEESGDIAAQKSEQYDALQGLQPTLLSSAPPLGENVARNDMLDLVSHEDDPYLNRKLDEFSAENETMS